MTVRVVVNAAWPDPEQAVAAGADGVGLPDSPRLFPDPLLAADRLLTGTDVAFAGPCVLGTGLRHPAVVAGALRTLADRHGAARVFAVLARGESSVRNEGLAPPRLDAHLDAVAGTAERLADVPVTLLGAASGPRTVTGTASRAGGVLLDVGLEPDVVAGAAAVARGAGAEACWLFLRATVTDTPATAVATLIGSCAHRLAAAPDWYHVPDDLRGEVRALAGAHDYARHGRETAAPQGRAADLVRDRFFAVGTAADVTARVRAVAVAAGGFDGVVIAGATGGLLNQLAGTVAAVRAGVLGEESS